jgi:hypothetical protein
MIALAPAKSTVTPLAMVNDPNVKMSIDGPPDCVIVVGVGSVCEQVAPLHDEPLNVTVPAHERFTAPPADRPASCVPVRFAGV